MVAEIGQCYKPAITAEETDAPGGGAFVISLDFELMWGVHDKRTIADYGRNILGVRQAVPALLDLFAARDIVCTWRRSDFCSAPTRTN